MATVECKRAWGHCLACVCVLVCGWYPSLQCSEDYTHTSCSAQGQMVHLLGERAHHAGRLHGHSVVHGWRDHCTLVEEGKREGEVERRKEQKKKGHYVYSLILLFRCPLARLTSLLTRSNSLFEIYRNNFTLYEVNK